MNWGSFGKGFWITLGVIAAFFLVALVLGVFK